jgi:hydroxyacid-oxoacid transhydrogenase
VNLLRSIQFSHSSSCPCHSNPNHHHHHQHGASSPSATVSRFADRTASNVLGHGNDSRRGYATPRDPAQQKEYAFEMAASSIRFGPGVTREVGMDFKNMGARRVCVVTDPTVDKLEAMRQVREALEAEGVEYVVYAGVKVEPKDYSYV